VTRLRLAVLCLPLLACSALGTAAALAATHAQRRAPGSRQRSGDAHVSAYEYELRGPAPATHRHRVHVHRATRRVQAQAKRVHVVVSSAPAAGSAAAEASMAKVLATPCANGQLTPEAGNLPALRAAVLCLINRLRAQHGEGPLATQPSLERAAEGHAQEMIALDYFEHVSPAGLTPVQRVREDGYITDPHAGYVIGENLAWGTYNLSTPEAIVAAWVASPEHLANILEAEYRDTGVAVVAQVPSMLSGGAPGATYAQEFGVIVH
jgi:uncharacterized protein YkwD